jgi:uncharacterized repeat protein (TIGR03803 family)
MPTRTEFQVMEVEERISPSTKRAAPTAAFALIVLVVLGPAGRSMAGSYTLTTLASFNDLNGAYPSGGLALDARGNLFGTTEFGGAGNLGTVFVVPAGTGFISTLAFFNYTNGDNPLGSTVLDARGNLFGTTANGGINGRGTVFELAAGSGSITTLASFNYTNGAHPVGGLILDAQGNLFGTTSNGGANGRGTVFEIVAGSGSLTTLASFNYTNGAIPVGRLALDAQGNLFGTTSNGGANGRGTVFEIVAGSGSITTLASFNGVNGAYASGGVALDARGNLFGTTQLGGANNVGTAFEVPAGSGSITTLASFNVANGANPMGGLILDAPGNLFGTTQVGGANDAGTAFEIAAGSGSITTLASFSTFLSGSGPAGGLILDARGNLFGTTQLGGANGLGTVFELSPMGGVVPEPASLVLMGLGLAGLAALALVTARSGGAA